LTDESKKGPGKYNQSLKISNNFNQIKSHPLETLETTAYL